MIYLASAYSHPDARVRQHRFEQACQAAAAITRAGLSVFSPISHSHPIARFGVPTGWEFWARIDHEFLSKADLLAVLKLDGWQASAGVQAEIALAGELGLPVIYVEPGEMDLEVLCNP